MKKEETHRPCCIWLNTIQKIASFHLVADYELHEFLDPSIFENYTLALISSGYRFQ